MAWLFISIPLMVVAVAVAVTPVAWQSFRHYHDEHGVRPVTPAGPLAPAAVATAGAATASAVGVACPVCAAHVRGASAEVLVDAVERHAWRFHGIPSAEHIVESSRVA